MGTYIQGIDVSKWQGQIDWQRVARDPREIEYAFIKATEGGAVRGGCDRGYEDPRLRENWEGAGREGIRRGAYHFARVSDRTGTGGYDLIEDARSEAEWFWMVLQEVGYDPTKDLPPTLDIEWDSRASDAGITAQQTLDWTLEFCSHMTGLCGRVIIVYTGPSFWQYKLLRTAELTRYPLWEADINNPTGQPKAMGPWQWLFHQYSHDGQADGIQGEVDLNAFRGTLADLDRFIATGSYPLPPPPPNWKPPCDLGLPLVSFQEDDWPTGEAVERIQAMLMSHGYGPTGLVGHDGLPDGQGGPRTREAVGRFQADAQLKQDFKVGEKTWWALLTKGIDLGS